MIDSLDIRGEEEHMRAKPQAAVDNVHPGLATTDGEMDSWVHMEQPRNKEGHALATQRLDIEKMRLDMELTMTRYRYEDNEKQREHEEKMEELRLQGSATAVSAGRWKSKIREETKKIRHFCFILYRPGLLS